MSDIKSCPVGAKSVSPSCHLEKKFDEGYGLLKQGRNSNHLVKYSLLQNKIELNYGLIFSAETSTEL